MGQRLRAYASLVRAFLTPTAIADSSAGFLAAAWHEDLATLPSVSWLGAAVASIALYWCGMAANDLFDREKDRRAGVPRPIITGAISVGAARLLVATLAATALLAGLLSGALVPVVAVLVCIFAYDAGAKGIPLLGNLLMGACRGGNLLVGAAAAVGTASALHWPELLVAAALLVIYIASVTAVSLLEDRTYHPRALALAAAPGLSFPLLFVAMRLDDPWVWANAAALLVLLCRALANATRLASSGEHRRGAAHYVQQGLGAIFLVDLGLFLTLVPSGTLRAVGVVALTGLLALFLVWKTLWLRGRPSRAAS